jgi:hypothetical protein
MPVPDDDRSAWIGHRLDAREGGGAGKITAFASGGVDAPGWLVVRTSRFGGATAVPAQDAVEGVGCVWVPYSRELIRQGPRVEAQERLDADAERRLREHYAVD